MSYLRKYATATATGTHIGIPMPKYGLSDFADNTVWTPAGGDVTVSIDGGTPANIGSLPTYSNGQWLFVFTAAELTGKSIRVSIVDQGSKVIDDNFFVIETFGNANALYAVDFSDATAFGLSRLDVNIGSRSNHSAADIWAVGTRTLTGFGSLVADIWTAIQDSPGVTTLLSLLTPSRAAYLDKLNITGQVASSAEVLAVSNNTSTRISAPGFFERPDSGSISFVVDLYIYDENGNMEAPDSTPTLNVTNQAGVSRNANLGSTTNPNTGHYQYPYTVSDTDSLEELKFEFTITEGGLTRLAGTSLQIVDTTAVDFTSTDRTTLNNLATAAALATVSNKIGSPAVSVTADVATLQSDLTALVATAANLATGAEIDTLSTQIGDVATQVSGVATSVGTLATAEQLTAVASAVDDVGTMVDGALTDLTSLQASIARALAMIGDNYVLENTTYDSNGNLTGATQRLYDSKDNADLDDGTTGLIGVYSIENTITSQRLTKCVVTRVS